jgi:hypothetical protein
VIQALKQMNFDSHIKLMTSEMDLAVLQNEEKSKEIIEDAQEMKDLNNKHKKKNKKKKRQHELNEDMINEQMELFEKSKLENMNLMYSQIESTVNKEYMLMNNNKKMKLDEIEQELFSSCTKNEEIDFD